MQCLFLCMSLRCLNETPILWNDGHSDSQYFRSAEEVEENRDSIVYVRHNPNEKNAERNITIDNYAEEFLQWALGRLCRICGWKETVEKHIPYKMESWIPRADISIWRFIFIDRRLLTTTQPSSLVYWCNDIMSRITFKTWASGTRLTDENKFLPLNVGVSVLSQS